MENKGGKRLAPTGEPVKTTPPATAADEVKTPAEQPAPAESAAPTPAETAVAVKFRREAGDKVSHLTMCPKPESLSMHYAQKEQCQV